MEIETIGQKTATIAVSTANACCHCAELSPVKRADSGCLTAAPHQSTRYIVCAQANLHEAEPEIYKSACEEIIPQSPSILLLVLYSVVTLILSVILCISLAFQPTAILAKSIPIQFSIER